MSGYRAEQRESCGLSSLFASFLVRNFLMTFGSAVPSTV